MKIIGQMVCGPGEADKYLKESLEDFKRLCDDAIICLCGEEKDLKKEEKVIKKYGFWFYYDNREWGREQPNIKTDLLRKSHKLGADWILSLDADETLPTLDRAELEKITEGRESAYFYVVNLWNDETRYSRALSFWNVRFFQADSSKGTQYLRKPLHCGSAPPYFYNQSAKASYVPHILLHKGLMDPEVRQRKAERYDRYDPYAEHKGRDYYDALIAEGTGSSYNQEAVHNKIISYCEQL